MINNIIKAAGLNCRKSRFLKPPAGTYGVYMDDVATDGPDNMVGWYTHSITLELYESSPDDGMEAAVEAAITAAGLQWTKQDRYWLQEEQRYQVIYEFEYIEKRRA
ncbi:MAG: hypothetical protein IKZ08_02885 [Bacteroidales bacterium]|nr:hypothetical protein [Bacteroidales bacterium]